MLISLNVPGNLHDAVTFINHLGVDRHLFHLECASPYKVSIAIFRIMDYPDYVRFCERIKREPLPPEEFFS